MARPAISILTPTYNRAQVLHRAYDSLVRQSLRDFEWVVVDDGSTDHTAELLARWQAEADFPVNWLRYRNNRGRNAAVNTGVQLVSGRYTLVLDSDDSLLDDALETVAYWREKTGIDDVASVYALRFRCVNADGTLHGCLPSDNSGHLPQKVMQVSVLDARYRLRIKFDTVTVAKTSSEQEKLFVELTRSEHCRPSISVSANPKDHEAIYVDVPIRKYFRGDGVPRLTDGYASRLKWPRGTYLWAVAVLNEHSAYLRFEPGKFLSVARKMVRIGLHLGRLPGRQYRDLAHTRARLLWAAGMPGGCFRYCQDRLLGHRVLPADSDISTWGPSAPPENPVLYMAPQRFGVPLPTIAVRNLGIPARQLK